MKIKTSKILSVFTFAILILFSSCKTSSPIPPDRVRLENPCQDEIDRARKENYIVASGTGYDQFDESDARVNAQLRTDQDLNRRIERLAIGIGSIFSKNNKISQSSNKYASFINYITTAAANQIGFDEVICDETWEETKESNNNNVRIFKHYHAVKLNKNIVINGIASAMGEASEELELKVDYEKEKFLKEYKEMINKKINEEINKN